jgi:pilus assembly protein FimV
MVNSNCKSAEDDHPMMNNNKILTVSYGTFSCTLEGFDDSFGTMKAIAEYFRDLAADDRYFGAEPPQPDAEMLARIAQREVSRKVEAHERDGKIVLSALEDQRSTAPVQPTPAPIQETAIPKKAVEDEQDQVTADNEVTYDVAAPNFEAEIADVETDIPVSDPVAIADTVIADTVIDANAADLVEETDEETVSIKLDEFHTDIDDATTSVAEFVEDENDIVPGQPDSEVKAFFAEAQPSKVAAAAVAGAVGVAAVARADGTKDTIAAKLQRIRAVVSQNTGTTDDNSYAEDEHANAKARLEETTTAEQEDIVLDVQDTVVIETLVGDTPDLVDEDMHSVEAVGTTKVDARHADLDDDDFEDENDDVDAILARLASATSADSEAADLDDITAAEADSLNIFEDTIEAAARSVIEMDEGADDLSEEDAQDTVAQTAPRARVIKVKRAELEAAIKKGALEEYDDALEEEEEQPAPPAVARKSLNEIAPSRGRRTSLTPDDEQELLRELARLEQDIEAEDSEVELPEIQTETAETHVETAQAPTEAPTPAAPLRKALRDPQPTQPERDTDVNRLLAEADHQMDEPESATRRDAFAHLRAAVASQKAEDALGNPASDEASDDAYRDDLAAVVRPRRPEAGGARTARPGEGRPAPLKLVAEQRIDVEHARSEGPIRPRRVAAAEVAETPAGETDSFADYAAEMGAETLPQLLEAAASYMSFVEGRDQFSRPQLMTKVRQSGAQDDFSREDGLRSFGQLLRTGKIEKIKGGRFTVSDDIGFQPDKRATG